MKYLFPNDFLTFIMNVEYNRDDFTLYILTLFNFPCANQAHKSYVDSESQ